MRIDKRVSHLRPKCSWALTQPAHHTLSIPSTHLTISSSWWNRLF